MSEWQPIDTAPKDGTRFLMVDATDNFPPEIEITEWCIIRQSHYEHVEGDLYRLVDDAPVEFWNGNGHRATHWMPLPAQPPNLTPMTDAEKAKEASDRA